MKLLDAFAGIGSFSLAFERAGAKTIAQIEIDKSRRSVLAKHFLDVRRLADVREVTANDFTETIDILAGGTPCQDLSIAGSGAGLAGTRSSLWFEYLRIARELKPRWLVWENVPNALSSNGGKDFRIILSGLDECGYHVAWRIVDAKYFGVPQRRRRIFLVGHLGDGRAAQVLFESASLPGTSRSRPAGWKEDTKVIGTLSASASGVARTGNGNEGDMLVQAIDWRNLRSNGDISGTLQAKSTGGYSLNFQNPVMVFIPSRYSQRKQYGIKPMERHISPTITQSMKKSPDSAPHIVFDGAVRRLTPLECERLQGFPDYWTAGHSDSRRYSMVGDSIAVPVSEWIARRIVAIDSQLPLAL